jgi:hypothetical protein
MRAIIANYRWQNQFQGGFGIKKRAFSFTKGVTSDLPTSIKSLSRGKHEIPGRAQESAHFA